MYLEQKPEYSAPEPNPKKETLKHQRLSQIPKKKTPKIQRLSRFPKKKTQNSAPAPNPQKENLKRQRPAPALQKRPPAPACAFPLSKRAAVFLHKVRLALLVCVLVILP